MKATTERAMITVSYAGWKATVSAAHYNRLLPSAEHLAQYAQSMRMYLASRTRSERCGAQDSPTLWHAYCDAIRIDDLRKWSYRPPTYATKASNLSHAAWHRDAMIRRAIAVPELRKVWALVYGSVAVAHK